MKKMKSKNIADCPLEWSFAFLTEAREAVDRYADLQNFGAGNLVSAMEMTVADSISFKLYVESFLKLAATILKSVKQVVHPDLDYVVMLAEKSISDKGYDSRVFYSRLLESIVAIYEEDLLNPPTAD